MAPLLFNTRSHSERGIEMEYSKQISLKQYFVKTGNSLLQWEGVGQGAAFTVWNDIFKKPRKETTLEPNILELPGARRSVI